MAQHRPTSRLSAAAAQVPVSGDKKRMQKGFLKQARPAISKGTSDMKIDSKYYFAFVGFPSDIDPYDMCMLIKEYCYDRLAEFNLQILGWSQHMENDELVRAVGVEFLASQRDAFDTICFEFRDVWWCNKRQLSTITGAENHGLVVWPPLPLPKAIVRSEARCPGSVCEVRPMESFVGTLVKSQRGHDVHSWITQQLQRKH